MRALVLGLVVAASCKTAMDYPVGGGGGGGGGNSLGVDAASMGSGSGSGSAVVRACVLTDPRDLTSCRGSGVAGLTVSLGSATATTADDGTFTIDSPTGTNVEWDVTGSTVVQSVTQYAGQAKISVMDATMLGDLQGANGVTPAAGTGALMMRIARNGAGVMGETVVAVPANDPYGTYYDGATASSWTQSGTGTFGTAYLPGIPVGTTSVRLSAGGTVQATISAIPIADGGVTFVIAEVH